jgi:alpha-L-fucosidase
MILLKTKNNLTLFLSLAIMAGNLVFCLGLSAQTKTLDQLKSDHANRRFGIFMHFNMNTFNPGWATSKVDPKTFAPTNLNCGQWASACKAAGATYGVLTAKHHDGFSLWNSAYTDYDVMASSYPQDIIKLYTDAFRAAGLGPGLYFSIWDVANGVNSNWSTMRSFVLGQLTELLTNYGQIPILATDGWAWNMGHNSVPYQEIRELVKSLQPDCLMMDINGLMEPWETDVVFVEEPKGLYCPADNIYAADQGQTISGDWFWNSSAADINSLKSLADIVSHLTTLEPRWCNLLLNCPPNKSGLFDAAIVTRLAEVGQNWKPNTSRAALPAQPRAVEHPVTPVTAAAASGTATNAIDGRCDAGYETRWESSSTLPQSITLDLGSVYANLEILQYLPRQDNSTTGNVTSYRIYSSQDGSSFAQVASGSWASDRRLKVAEWSPVTARYIRFEATAATGGFAAIAEITVGGRTNKPAATNATAEPTSAVTTIPTTAPTSAPGIKGDVNGSGIVDIVDALLIAQYYVGLNPASFDASLADVNCSGAIDIVDALLIAQRYVGLIATLPC